MQTERERKKETFSTLHFNPLRSISFMFLKAGDDSGFQASKKWSRKKTKKL